jgi:hypothetical protein
VEWNRYSKIALQHWPPHCVPSQDLVTLASVGASHTSQSASSSSTAWRSNNHRRKGWRHGDDAGYVTTHCPHPPDSCCLAQSVCSDHALHYSLWPRESDRLCHDPCWKKHWPTPTHLPPETILSNYIIATLIRYGYLMSKEYICI